MVDCGGAWWSQMYQVSWEIVDLMEVELILGRKKK